MNYGFSGLNLNLNPQAFNNNNLGKENQTSARVISVVLDENHPRFKELGGWTALGAIEYDSTLNPKYNFPTYPVAYPLDPNIKKFPLINEIVIIQSGFSSAVDFFEEEIDITSGRSKKYYTTCVGIWNHPHHNGYSFNILENPPSQNKTYSQIQAGSVSQPTNSPIEINLGKTFKEKANIHPLLPFEGDIIYEGRWGNSIRFGSTIIDNTFSNNWSIKGVGQNGDPIIIINNGQGLQDDNGSKPIIEDINNNNSSIYLTSTQQIPLKVSSDSYVSYNKDKAPSNPNKFSGEQILLNSGRLVFNSKSDHILLTSAKSINLNSIESINIDTKDFIVQSNKIYLGSNQAAEPLMLGNKTTDFLKELILTLKNFMTVSSVATTTPCVPGSSATLPAVQVSAQQVLSVLNKLEESLIKKDLTSDRNYTIK